MDGRQFEVEIRQQPAVLRRLASAPFAAELDRATGTREVIFTGSGSSLFVAQLAALAWRRHGRPAVALAASEARFQAAALRGRCVVALSQSGRTADVLDAVDALEPAHLIALTNDAASPLTARAGTAFELEAGPERAVPASKSVTAMAALLLWAAAIRTHDGAELARELERGAATAGTWLDADPFGAMAAPAALLEPAHSIIVIGAGYGVPIAAEVALKINEASYHHAEGFGAGEFRHGSTAILDPARAVVGLVDSMSRPAVEAVLAVARAAGSSVVLLGEALPGAPGGALSATGVFAPLVWIVAGQVLALALARRAGVDSDAPRGLHKFLA